MPSDSSSNTGVFESWVEQALFDCQYFGEAPVELYSP